MTTMVSETSEDAAFSVIPTTAASIFASARVTPEQLASAARVREHAIECEARVRREVEAPSGIDQPLPAQAHFGN